MRLNKHIWILGLASVKSCKLISIKWRKRGYEHMAKYRIDYFLKDTDPEYAPLYNGRRIEKNFDSSKDALLWVAEKLSKKSECFEIKKLPEISL